MILNVKESCNVMLMFTSRRRSVIALNERTLQGHFFISVEDGSFQLSLICHFLWFAVEIYVTTQPVTIERYDRLQVKLC